MDLQEEILKKRRQNEQYQSLEKLKGIFGGYFRTHDFYMHIEITLDDYKPEYCLMYDKDTFPDILEGYSRELSTQVNGYYCRLFEELESFDEGWYYTCEKKNGGSIFIKNDGLLIYHWHYNYPEEKVPHILESKLMLAYFTMFICFLQQFYNSINYIGKISLSLNLHGIEHCAFQTPESRELMRYNNTPYTTIKRIIFLNKIAQREEKVRIIHEIFTRILSRYFNYYHFTIPQTVLRRFKI